MVHNVDVNCYQEELSTRVCNEVQFRLKNLPKDKLPSDAVKGNKDKGIVYCIKYGSNMC